MKQYTETQIRQKIILYISSRTNHKKVLKIEKDNPPVKIDTGINAPIYFTVEVETYNFEKVKVIFHYENEFLHYGIIKNKYRHICDTKKLNQIF